MLGTCGSTDFTPNVHFKVQRRTRLQLLHFFPTPPPRSGLFGSVEKPHAINYPNGSLECLLNGPILYQFKDRSFQIFLSATVNYPISYHKNFPLIQPSGICLQINTKTLIPGEAAAWLGA